ncbi:MAG: hypothetical protein N2446_02910, partial [Elusimicrobiales bacterium]|nr:hypothetical protein [Elusimicrobiales bacterium]
ISFASFLVPTIIKLFCSSIADAIIEGRKARETELLNESQNSNLEKLSNNEQQKDFTKEYEDIAKYGEEVINEDKKQEAIEEAIEENIVNENN